MQLEQRNFLGIWLPIDLILATDLSLTEKILLKEIESLDNADGCFASNKFFAERYNLTVNWISISINKLIKKGLIFARDTSGRRVLHANKAMMSDLGYTSTRKLPNAREGAISHGVEPTEIEIASTSQNNQGGVIPVKGGVTPVTGGCDSNQRGVLLESKHSNTSNNTSNTKVPKVTEVTQEHKTEESKTEQEVINFSEKKMGKLSLSSLDPVSPRTRKILSSPDELEVLKVYQQNIYPHVKASTNSIFEGVPYALRVYATHFGKNACSMLCRALREIVANGKIQWQKDQDPLAIMPKVIFSKSYIENTLLPLSFNQYQNGGIHTTRLSEEERRKIEEANAEGARQLRKRLGLAESD